MYIQIKKKKVFITHFFPSYGVLATYFKNKCFWGSEGALCDVWKTPFKEMTDVHKSSKFSNKIKSNQDPDFDSKLLVWLSGLPKHT